MVNLEFTVRVLVFISVAIIFSLVYFKLGKRIFTKFRIKHASLILATVSAALGIFTLFLFFFVYVYHGFGYQPDIYRTGNRAHNKVALTFDDGPSEEFTPLILDILDHYQVPATFFMVGNHVEKFPDVAKRIIDEGHTIGNHTQSHRNIPTLSTMDLHREIVEATASIFEATGVYPSYIRPPRGMYDDRLRRLSKLLGQEIVLWSISTRDWRYGVTPSYIVRFVDSKVRGGDIILFHDSGALLKNEGGDRMATVLALPEVIELIQAKGLEIVPLSELLYDAPTELFPQIDRPE